MEINIPKDVDGENILARFNTLESRPSRRAVYLGLLNRLNKYELRELKDGVNQYTFNFDILSSLPLEIAAQVTQYLDLPEMISLQRVSKQWQEILSSHHVRDTVLRRRTGRGLSAAESESTVMRYVRQRVRVERADFIRSTMYRSLLKYPNDGTTGVAKMDYSHGRCASIENGVTVAVFCLLAGKVVYRFDTENREPISDISISDALVVTVTRGGRCYAWNHHTGDSFAPFRLPSINYQAFVVSGRKVAFSFPGATGTNSIIRWDPESRDTDTIRVPPELVLLSLHPKADDLTTIHLCRNDDDEAHLQILTYSLPDTDTDTDHDKTTTATDSQQHDQLSTPTSSRKRDLNTHLTEHVEEHLSISRCEPGLTKANSRLGFLTLNLRSNHNNNNNNNHNHRRRPHHHHQYLIISYDPEVSRLSLHEVDLENPIQPTQAVSPAPGLIYYATEGLTRGGESPTVWVSNPGDDYDYDYDTYHHHHHHNYHVAVSGTIATTSSSGRSSSGLQRSFLLPRHQTGYGKYLFWGDLQFFVAVDRNLLLVYCLDEEVVLPAGSGELVVQVE